MEYPKFLASSQDSTTLKLRIKAFFPLVVPLVNGVFPEMLPENLDAVVDSVFVLVALCAHLYGWYRAKMVK